MKRVVLEIAGLQQRLFDPGRGEEFTVFVEDPVRILEGDFVAVLGPSGCGKTTLLTVLGLLRKPTRLDDLETFRVTVRSNGELVECDLKEAWLKGRSAEIEKFRRQHLGFALQSGELLSALTVRENISVPLELNDWTRDDRDRRVAYLLEAFGLRRRLAGSDNASELEEPATMTQEAAEPPDAEETTEELTVLLDSARANKLSGGEHQRVALARAIAHEPTIVFVDEPTAALNRELARGALQQLSLLQQGKDRFGATVMITHDEQLAEEFANVVIRMEPMMDRPAGRVLEVIRTDDNGKTETDGTELEQPPGQPPTDPSPEAGELEQ